MGYYSKLDKHGQNPDGFVERFKVPETIVSEAYMYKSAKANKIAKPHSHKHHGLGRYASNDKLMCTSFHNHNDYEFNTIPHSMTDLWSANMRKIKGDQREFHKVLTSRQMYEMSKSKEEMLSKRKMIQRQVKEKIVSVVGKSGMEVM